jgi:hypothetical protein
VGGYVQLEDLGDFRVKGTSASMRAHRLAGTGTATTRLEVSRARGLTRFVGRGADMATLEAALAQAGHGQVVGAVGAAGTVTMITPARDATDLISRSASQLPMPGIIRSSRTMFSGHYDSRKAHEAGFDAHLRELWQRLLERPVSEYGTLCHGDEATDGEGAPPEGGNVAGAHGPTRSATRARR